MSELNNNTPASIDDGIPSVSFNVRVADTVQSPIDDTLTIEGMAADAKATGDAINAAKAELQAEIDDIETGFVAVIALLFPVGSVYVSTSATAPTFGNNWTWVEFLMPATWGDLQDGARSYKDKEIGDVPGTLHFWRRTA